ncbi:hypothetical protein KJ359_007555 [Pestalotiopsis sp. 9143b]|nr:hypothetical protein KJ359_007555 [Pestalotiopsis sp. 9143b]
MKFDIKIISDTVCPWCYVGKRRLEAGIAAYKSAHPNSDDVFTVSWYPFYLDPTAPMTGESKAGRYIRKFGEARWPQIQKTLSDAGRESGIDFKFGGQTGHTRESHRLIRFAGRTGGPELQNKVVDELFRRYFEQEQDITARATVQGAAEAAGLDAAEVERYLDSEEGIAEVEGEVARAQQLGVSGVPNIRINGQFEAPGAVDADVFKQIFEKLAERAQQ